MTSDAMSPLVVLLEDDPRSANALMTLLGDWGFECLHGESVEQALPLLRDRAGEVRAIISDFHLADGTTGVDAARRLAAAGVVAPTLLLTGTLRGSARRAASAAGHRFLEKPAPPETLRRWLDEAVDRAR